MSLERPHLHVHMIVKADSELGVRRMQRRRSGVLPQGASTEPAKVASKDDFGWAQAKPRRAALAAPRRSKVEVRLGANQPVIEQHRGAESPGDQTALLIDVGLQVIR
jgi:hypothetical protein